MNVLLAAVLVLELPLGPGSEPVARQLAAPHVHAAPIEGGAWHLWDIRVQPSELVYLVSLPHEPPAAVVRVHLAVAADAAGETGVEVAAARADLKEPPAAALEAAEAVADTIRRRFADGGVQVRGRAPPPADSPADLSSGVAQQVDAATATGTAPTGGTPRWLALALLALLAAGLLLSSRRWWAPLRAATGWRWAAGVGVVTATQAALLFWLPDVVLHPNAHGWDLVRVLAGDATSPFPLFERYGTLHVELARLLGAVAAPGHETFLASRIAGIAVVPLVFALGTTGLAAPRAGLIGAGLLASAPALLFAARGETVTAPGLLLVVLTAWLAATAARRRDLALLAVAALAAACLASFRLMGPILAPAAAAFALLGAAPGVTSPKHWRVAVVTAAAAAVALAFPHLLQIGTMMTAEMAARTNAAEVPNTLLTSPMLTPAALPLVAAAGVIMLALGRRLTALLLTAWVALALVAPASSSGWYQDQARYQTMMLPALCLAAGWAVHGALSLPQRRIGALASLLALAALLPNQHLAGRVMSVDQAEAQQLYAWRQLAAHLPPGAWVIVPVRTRSKARTSLPDTELKTARPDVRIVSLDEVRPGPGRETPSGDRPLFWFEPLSCSARYPGEPDEVASDCVAARRELVLRPVRSWGVDAELPPAIAAALRDSNVPGLFPTRGNPQQWNPRPFDRAPLRIGLYSVAGFVGGSAAGSGAAAGSAAAAGSGAADGSAAGSLAGVVALAGAVPPGGVITARESSTRSNPPAPD